MCHQNILASILFKTKKIEPSDGVKRNECTYRMSFDVGFCLRFKRNTIYFPFQYSEQELHFAMIFRNANMKLLCLWTVLWNLFPLCK